MYPFYSQQKSIDSAPSNNNHMKTSMRSSSSQGHRTANVGIPNFDCQDYTNYNQPIHKPRRSDSNDQVNNHRKNSQLANPRLMNPHYDYGSNMSRRSNSRGSGNQNHKTISSNKQQYTVQNRMGSINSKSIQNYNNHVSGDYTSGQIQSNKCSRTNVNSSMSQKMSNNNLGQANEYSDAHNINSNNGYFGQQHYRGGNFTNNNITSNNIVRAEYSNVHNINNNFQSQNSGFPQSPIRPMTKTSTVPNSGSQTSRFLSNFKCKNDSQAGRLTLPAHQENPDLKSPRFGTKPFSPKNTRIRSADMGNLQKTPSPKDKPTNLYENYNRLKQKRNSNPANMHDTITSQLVKLRQKANNAKKKEGVKKKKSQTIFECVNDGEPFDLDELRRELFLGAVIVPWDEYLQQLQKDQNNMMAGSILGGMPQSDNTISSKAKDAKCEMLSLLKDQVLNPRVAWGPKPLAHIRRQREMTKQYTLEYILDIIPSKPLIIRKYIEDLNKEKFQDRWFLAENLNSEKFDILEQDVVNVNKKSDVLLELFRLEYPNLCGLGRREEKKAVQKVKSSKPQVQFDSGGESPSTKSNKSGGQTTNKTDALNNFEKTFLQTSDLIIFIFRDDDQLDDDSLYYHITSKTVLAIDALTRSTNDYPFTNQTSESEFISWYKVDLLTIFNETFQQFSNLVNKDYIWKMEEFMYSYLALISFNLNSLDYNRSDDDDPITDKYTYRPIGLTKPKYYFMFCDKILVKFLKNYDKFQYKNFKIPEIDEIEYSNVDHFSYPFGQFNYEQHLDYNCSEGSECKNNRDDGISSVSNEDENTSSNDEYETNPSRIASSTSDSKKSKISKKSQYKKSDYSIKIKKFREICNKISEQIQKSEDNLHERENEERCQMAKDDFKNIVQNLYNIFRQAHLDMRDMMEFR